MTVGALYAGRCGLKMLCNRRIQVLVIAPTASISFTAIIIASQQILVSLDMRRNTNLMNHIRHTHFERNIIMDRRRIARFSDPRVSLHCIMRVISALMSSGLRIK